MTFTDYVGMATRSCHESFTPLSTINGFRSTSLWPIHAAEPLEAMKNVEPSEKKKKESKGNAVHDLGGSSCRVKIFPKVPLCGTPKK